MDIIRPATTTDSTLTSSNVTEDDYAEWNGTADSYSIDDFVMVSTAGVHKTYQAIIAIPGSGGNLSPELDTLESVPKWIESGSTNKWKMFTPAGGEQTSNVGNITARITPNEIVNSVALLQMEADSVQVVMTDPVDGIVYDNTINLVSTDGINDWFNYFFEPLSRSSDAVLTDLPSYGTAYIDIIITSSSTARCGIAILGTRKSLGGTQFGASVGITDYSVKDVDDFGRSTVLQRAFVKRMEVDLFIDSNKTDDIHKTLSAFRASPLVWIGADQYTSTFIYGYYKDFDVVIAYHSLSTCSLEIEGLI